MCICGACDIRNKTYVPVFYRANNIWVLVRARMNKTVGKTS